MTQFGKKQEADHLYSISVSWLRKHGYFDGVKVGKMAWALGDEEPHATIEVLSNTRDETPYVYLQYAQTDLTTQEKKEIAYEIPLTKTPCNYGGYRYWFICPLVKAGEQCHRRVGILYKGGDYFGCRHCYELTYASRNKSKNPMWGFFDDMVEYEKLKSETTTLIYNGKLTRKGRRLMTLYARLERNKPLLDELGNL